VLRSRVLGPLDVERLQAGVEGARTSEG